MPLVRDRIVALILESTAARIAVLTRVRGLIVDRILDPTVDPVAGVDLISRRSPDRKLVPISVRDVDEHTKQKIVVKQDT